LMAILNDATERGLIRKVKKPKVRQSETLIRTLSDAELVALYKAAAGATWPRHEQFTPKAFWEAFIVLMVLYGLRLGELLSLPWFEAASGKKLARGIHPGELCPRPELRNLGLISERGWLVYLPPKQALAKPLPLVLPLHALAADHLEAIRGDRRFVFDVYSELKTKTPGDYRDVKVSIYRQWNALCDAAGFTEELRATPHDLRRTQETRYDLQLGKGTGGEVNGHAARSVSETYYSQAIPRIHRAVLSVSLPQFCS
jgi:integrase